ncbi:MAG: hypothetical protein R2873_11850 [Caldilineaceae bacterium]
MERPQQDEILAEIQGRWQDLGGQLIVEHPSIGGDVTPTWLAFGIAGDLDLDALQTLCEFVTGNGWDHYVHCDLPTFLHIGDAANLSLS